MKYIFCMTSDCICMCDQWELKVCIQTNIVQWYDFACMYVWRVSITAILSHPSFIN